MEERSLGSASRLDLDGEVLEVELGQLVLKRLAQLIGDEPLGEFRALAGDGGKDARFGSNG